MKMAEIFQAHHVHDMFYNKHKRHVPCVFVLHPNLHSWNTIWNWVNTIVLYLRWMNNWQESASFKTCILPEFWVLLVCNLGKAQIVYNTGLEVIHIKLGIWLASVTFRLRQGAAPHTLQYKLYFWYPHVSYALLRFGTKPTMSRKVYSVIRVLTYFATLPFCRLACSGVPNPIVPDPTRPVPSKQI